MKTYRLYQIDSFTTERFRGNPAGVVQNADGLTEEQMLMIAREMNDSETAFIFSSNDPAYDVEVRFFTPKTEVALCGHATVAAHYVRAIEGSARPGRWLQKTKAGILPVDIIEDGDDYAVVMTQSSPYVSEPLAESDVTDIAAALGISVPDIREDCPVAIAAAGPSKVMVGIKSREQLHGLSPNEKQLIEISRRIGSNGYYVFTLSPEEDVLVHGRMFGPAVGISEDPVTGNANGPIGLYMVKYGICRELQKPDSFDFEIIQGEAIGRRGGMKVHIDIQNGVPVGSQITGRAVTAFKTEINI